MHTLVTGCRGPGHTAQTADIEVVEGNTEGIRLRRTEDTLLQ
jgi:hypothetical protein